MVKNRPPFYKLDILESFKRLINKIMATFWMFKFLLICGTNPNFQYVPMMFQPKRDLTDLEIDQIVLVIVFLLILLFGFFLGYLPE